MDAATNFPVFLVGPRGSGKSTVGGLVAQRLNRMLRDTDVMVTAAAGMSVSGIVECEGWAGFRLREQAALAEAALSDAVVATGGGAVLSEENRRLMRGRGVVVYLSAPAACLCGRLAACGDAAGLRPSLTGLDPLDEVERVLREREPLYRESAHRVVDASADPESVAGAVAAVVLQFRAAAFSRSG